MSDARFEERLLHELRAVVAARPTPPAASPRPSRRPRLMLAASGGFAAVAAAVVLVSSDGGVSPAYAVDKEPDGSVTVHIKSLNDAAGLQSKLRAEGVPAVVSYATGPGVPGCAAQDGGDGPVTTQAPEKGTSRSTGDDGPTFQTGGTAPKGDVARANVTSTVRTDSDGTTFNLNPGTLKPGEQVYVTTAGGPDVSRVGIAIC